MNLHKISGRGAVAAALILGAGLASHSAWAQSWEYKSYKKTMGGQYDKNHFVVGTISIEQKDGHSFFRMIAGGVDVCYRGALPASVTRTDALTTIEVTQPVTGCDVFRYLINNDGSGGIKEVKVGESWVPSRFDHGLTPSK
jgi:hypothetical protein